MTCYIQSIIELNLIKSSKYKLALMLFKLYRDKIPSREWLALNDEQTFTSRQTKFHVNSTSNYKVGYNTPTRQLALINNKIELVWLNLSFDSYKIKCKNLFLKIIKMNELISSNTCYQLPLQNFY